MGKIRCAICDDEYGFCAYLASLAEQAFENKQVDVEVKMYVDSNRLAQEIKSGETFDVYFLDIEMPGINGVDLAKLIRKRYDFRKAVLVFISSHTEYHDQLLQLQPYRFLYKTNYSTTLLFILEEVADLYRINTAGLDYAVNKLHYFVPYEDIICMESLGRKILITYWNINDLKENKYNGVLRDELEKLPDAEFCSPHVSYIVNFAHVRKIVKNEIVLCTNQIVPISDRKYARTLEKYHEFIYR